MARKRQYLGSNQNFFKEFKGLYRLSYIAEEGKKETIIKITDTIYFFQSLELSTRVVIRLFSLKLVVWRNKL
jgi:hypothetical protein